MDAQITFKNNHNNQIIPYIDSTPLHSENDPIGEAKKFILHYNDKIKNNNTFVILGLGHGYHVNQLSKNLQSFSNNYKILVIEPHNELVQRYREHNDGKDPRVKILSQRNMDKLYRSRTLIRTLTQKPAILVHRASLDCNEKYFREFLSFQASSDITDYVNELPIEIQNYLQNQSAANLSELLSQNKQQQFLSNQEDYFFFALNHILSNENQSGQQ